jgi:hypothetical protein
VAADDDWDDEEDEYGDPYLLALRRLGALRPTLDRLEAALVDGAREHLCTWAEIGAELGLTKTGVYRRHGQHDPVAARRRARRAAGDSPDAWF